MYFILRFFTVVEYIIAYIDKKIQNFLKLQNVEFEFLKL
jgi:hypothetical protein